MSGVYKSHSSGQVTRDFEVFGFKSNLIFLLVDINCADIFFVTSLDSKLFAKIFLFCGLETRRGTSISQCNVA